MKSTIQIKNLSLFSCIVRFIIGGTMIGYTLSLSTSPLGIYTFVVLIAIYPVMTGMLGWDPVVEVLGLIAGRKNAAACTIKR